MKIKFVCALLLSTASAADVQLAEATSDDTTPDDDNLSSLLSSALAGAKPGVIREPSQKNTDTEGDKQITKGLTKNYRFHWQYACAFTKWIPSN